MKTTEYTYEIKKTCYHLLQYGAFHIFLRTCQETHCDVGKCQHRRRPTEDFEGRHLRNSEAGQLITR